MRAGTVSCCPCRRHGPLLHDKRHQATVLYALLLLVLWAAILVALVALAPVPKGLRGFVSHPPGPASPHRL